MMDETSQLPRHIAQLFKDIRGCTDLEACLAQASPLCQKDLSLLHLFHTFGYAPDSGKFLRPLDRNEILNGLLEEYLGHSAFEPLDSFWGSSNQGVKSELLRTYMDNHIDLLSPPDQLGFVDYCLPDLSFGLEDNSLSTMWSYAEPSAEPGSPDSNHSANQASVLGFPSSRKSRGLRVISVRVNELVALKKQTSYKEVADQLIAELALPPGPDQFKEEKNVRRRVYDALNVLVSAGVVEKVGKLVTWRKSHTPRRKSFSEQAYLSDLKRTTTEKRQHLLDLVKKSQALKSLIQRNSSRECGTILMKLPFLVVVPEGTIEGVRSM
mmetsp:Transcript_9751/g.19085  ORF Transcript_9751/g.19085 Transcript_9751/m.19085 type:complete len:324 (-) Transcript_9751:3507-4478(-)